MKPTMTTMRTAIEIEIALSNCFITMEAIAEIRRRKISGFLNCKRNERENK
jgi:hypothetical protein